MNYYFVCAALHIFLNVFMHMFLQLPQNSEIENSLLAFIPQTEERKFSHSFNLLLFVRIESFIIKAISVYSFRELFVSYDTSLNYLCKNFNWNPQSKLTQITNAPR